MLVEGNDVNVSWTDFGIIDDHFLFGPGDNDEEGWIRPHIYDWVAEYRDQGHKIELLEWMVPYAGPETIVERVEGVTFRFENTDMALLFKLTWGGK